MVFWNFRDRGSVVVGRRQLRLGRMKEVKLSYLNPEPTVKRRLAKQSAEFVKRKSRLVAMLTGHRGRNSSYDPRVQLSDVR